MGAIFVLDKYAVGFGIGRFRIDVPLATERIYILPFSPNLTFQN